MTDAAASAALRPLALQPLPLGDIRPQGWLARQLRIQADGLTGLLDEFWPDVKESGWIGGSKEGWERGPYWLDGAYPLAVLLDDAALKAKVTRWVDYILSHQHADGWLGPVTDGKHSEYDPWPVFIVLKILAQHYEATGDARALAAMEKFLQRLAILLKEKPLRSWASARWPEVVWAIHWLHSRRPADWLLQLAATAKTQGLDWLWIFRSFPYTHKITDAGRKEHGLPDGPAYRPEHYHATHVVNNAMAIKAAGVWYRQTGDDADRQAVYAAIDTLDRYHGQAAGGFSGDEHLATTSPSQGTETCAVVEYLFSLEVLLSILGDAALADRLELIAYNALPAPFTPDMWARQYAQQATQIAAARVEDRVYTNNGPDANMYGLETHFGCCTANMHQGWPKFAAHLWMKRPATDSQLESLVALAYAPCEITTTIAGSPVKVEVKTDYPFEDKISITVSAAQPARFALELRIPAWAEGATVTPGSEKPQSAAAGSFHCIDREWSGATTVLLTLPMHWRVQHRYNNSLTLLRGPLVFSLNPGVRWEKVRDEPPTASWRTLPVRPWNYALAINPADPGRAITLNRQALGDCPFSPAGSPLRAYAPARRLPNWDVERGAAAPPAKSPVQTAEPIEQVELLPYGCAKLRVTELPWTSA